MKNLGIKVTNKRKFDDLVDYVDAESKHTREDRFHGDVTIHTLDGGEKTISGEHSYSGYEEEYGFIILKS